jgi:hypothetical protein
MIEPIDKIRLPLSTVLMFEGVVSRNQRVVNAVKVSIPHQLPHSLHACPAARTIHATFMVCVQLSGGRVGTTGLQCMTVDNLTRCWSTSLLSGLDPRIRFCTWLARVGARVETQTFSVAVIWFFQLYSVLYRVTRTQQCFSRTSDMNTLKRFSWSICMHATCLDNFFG